MTWATSGSQPRPRLGKKAYRKPGSARAMARVLVDAPARLHLGFFPAPQGIGAAALSIHMPRLFVTMGEATGVAVRGPEGTGVRETLDVLVNKLGIGPGADVNVGAFIPRHQGLGSGSRLVLALGLGIVRLYDEEHDPMDLARITGRARHSRAGVVTFLKGGLAVDPGVGEVRFGTVPPTWAFLLGLPGPGEGLSGEEEDEIMGSDWSGVPGPEDLGEKLLCAAKSGDIEDFASAVSGMDEWTGRCFSRVQGGKYTSPVIEEGVRLVREAGALAAGQSSWGPAFYGLFPDAGSAKTAIPSVQSFLDQEKGQVLLVFPDNRPASITFVDMPDLGL